MIPADWPRLLSPNRKFLRASVASLSKSVFHLEKPPKAQSVQVPRSFSKFAQIKLTKHFTNIFSSSLSENTASYAPKITLKETSCRLLVFICTLFDLWF